MIRNNHILRAAILLSVLFGSNTGALSQVPVTTDSTAMSIKDTVMSIPETTSLHMTLEQYEAYSDSIYRSRYPEPVYVENSAEEAYGLSEENSQPLRDQVNIYTNSYVPSSVNINTNYEVGQIDIESGVSPSGARTYNVPIKVFDANGVFAPTISLTYNSQGGYGAAGKGWDVGGIQVITRGSCSMYYDGQATAVTMTTDDAFFLNGVRLICVSNSDYIYETEQGHIKVKGVVSNNDFTKFYVYYPNGWKGEFGFSSSLEYPITKLTDEKGRYISYTYSSDGYHNFISQIRYAYDMGLGIINFTYNDNRTDYVRGYMAGRNLDSYKLLKSITSSFGGSSLGIYTLTHTTDDGNTLLTEIGYSANGSTLNPLKFYYGNGGSIRTYNIASSLLSWGYSAEARGLLSAVRGRFKYRDGEDAIAYYPFANPYYLKIQSGHYRVENKYDPDKNIHIYSGLGNEVADPMPRLRNGDGFIEVLFADIDGQMGESLVKINNTATANSETLAFRIYKPYSVSGYIRSDSCFFTLNTSYSYNGHHSVQPKYYYAGDFTGNGRMEVLAVSANNPFGDGNHPSKCYIFDLTSHQIIYEGSPLTFLKTLESASTTAQAAEDSSDKLLAIDVDGDGKTDLCHVRSNCTDVYTFERVGGVLTARQMSSTVFLTRFNFENRFYSYGDFNGDGLADIIAGPHRLLGGSDWTIRTSMGNGQFLGHIVTGPAVSTTQTTDFCVQDIDGDGICDLAEVRNDTLFSFLVKNYTITADAITTLPDDKCTVVPVSINSSTLSHQFIAINGYTPTLYSYSYDKRRAHALTGMANSLGVVEKNYYYTIRPADPNINDSIYNLNYYSYPEAPYASFNGPLMLLAGNEIFVGGVSMDINKYFYDTAVLHNQGLGFQGFHKLCSQNKHGQYSYWFYNPMNYDVLQSVISPTSETIYTNNVSVAPNKIVTAQVTSKVINDYLTGTTSTTSYTYDTYGNVLTENMQTDGNISVNKYNSYYNYTDIDTKYRLGLPHLNSQETWRGNSSYYESTSIDSYNDFFQPLTVVNTVNGFTSKTTGFTYDNNGNMTSQSVDLYSSCTPRTTTYQYDTYKRLKKIIDPIGIYKQFTYQSDGKLTSTQTYTGTTTYTYDNLNRLVSEQRPDTTEVATAYAWTTSGGRYSVTKTETGQPTTATYYDALNRETQTTRKNFNNSTSVIRKTYDNYGRLSQESLPFYNGSSNILWNTYSYDYYDRLTQHQEPTGMTTTYTYSGLSTTTNDGTKQITTTRDALGAVVSVTDPAGTVSYTLNGAGKPLSITAPGDVTTTFYYNMFGQLAVVNDPTQGTKQYTHDVFGNLMLVQEANNAITNYYYDNDCRMTSKSIGGFTTTYTYDNNLNKLTSAVSSNGTSKTYTYDALGRLASQTEIGKDSVWLRKDFTYAGGRVASTKYTSSQSGLLATENYAYTNGYLTKVALADGTVISQLNYANAFQQPTNVTTGTFTRTYGYNSYGLPTSRQVMRSNTTHQNLSYTFNSQTGNLTSRTDNINSLTESFAYDNLRRLTSFAGNTVGYDVKGNITSLGDVGTFEYDAYTRPYAVSDIWRTNTSITLDEQEVSYYPFHRPQSVSEDGNTYTFTYNGDYDRVAMTATAGILNGHVRHYLGGQYEMETQPSAATNEYLYLGGDYYSAPAVLVKSGNTNNLFFIMRDHLGSITRVVHSSGGYYLQNVSYDAWGRMRNPQTGTLYTLQNMPTLFLRRGYCGHEHIPGTGLINMNARLYDPLIGRFLSPDPYVQEAWNSQNYNRYSYCLNNPLVYKDEDGELFFFFKFAAAALAGFVKGVCEWTPKNWYAPFYRMYKNAMIDLKIDAGLFQGSAKQIASRLTWENFQTFGGLVTSSYNTILHDVERVEYYGGATYVINENSSTNGTKGFTLGSYINITTSEEIPMDGKQFAPYKNRTYAHEYGHYLQSQESGFGYLFEYAIPSFVDYLKNHKKEVKYLYVGDPFVGRALIICTTNKHHLDEVEIDANKRAADYFFKGAKWPYLSEGYPTSLDKIIIL